VIVFTHDVQFVKALLDRAPAAGLSKIHARDASTGLVSAARVDGLS
jgi:hypothetical protein